MTTVRTSHDNGISISLASHLYDLLEIYTDPRRLVPRHWSPSYEYIIYMYICNGSKATVLFIMLQTTLLHVVLILCSVGNRLTATATTGTPPRAVWSPHHGPQLDLSYTTTTTTTTTHHDDMKTTSQLISNRVRRFVNDHVSNQSGVMHDTLVIDVSHSNLGDTMGLECFFVVSLLLPSTDNHNSVTNTTAIATTEATTSATTNITTSATTNITSTATNITSTATNNATTSSTRNDNNNNNNATPLQMGMDLIVRGNRLNSQQVTLFLNDICATHHQPNGTEEEDPPSPTVFWRSLDFGENLLHTNRKRHIKAFHAALQAILTNRNSRVEELHLSCCGLGPSTCRALAKGLRNRFHYYSGDRSSAHDNAIGISPPPRRGAPVSLDLSNNRDIGDSGAAALAAAIRMGRSDNTTAPMFDTLDLSACDIGDVGMEALALALEDAVAPVMIRRLVLCHNRITDRGAIALGQALHRNINGSELHIDLSNNPLVTDRGITTLLSAVEKGCVSNLIVRSCSIQADGAELVGRTLRSMALSAHHRPGGTMEIDLSGNPIGILRSKTDKGNMYSAGAIKSKASATASAYVSQGLSFLKKGLGSVGVTLIPESDDDDDESSASALGTVEESDKGKNLRCGFKSLANAFIGNEQDVHTAHAEVHTVKHVLIGLRRTFCDTAGADALAAMITAAKEQYPGLNLKFELDLNPVVEDTMVNALYGHDDEILAEMADRHNEAMDIIRQAHERAVTAAKMLAARRQRPAVASSSASSQYDTYESDDYYDDSDESFGDVEDEADLDDEPWESDDDYDEEY